MGTDLSTWNLVGIAILNIALLYPLIRFEKKIVNAFERFIEKMSWTMFLWDLCVFGRDYYLRLLKWRQDLIDRLRGSVAANRKDAETASNVSPFSVPNENNRENTPDSHGLNRPFAPVPEEKTPPAVNSLPPSSANTAKNVFLYVIATRPQYLVGLASLLYVLFLILFSAEPAQRFLDMTANTVAGSLGELFDLFSAAEDTSSLLYVIFASAIANYFAYWIFIPRFDRREDKVFWKRHEGFMTNLLPRLLLSLFDPLLYTATVLFFSDLFNAGLFRFLFSFTDRVLTGMLNVFDLEVGGILLLILWLLGLFVLFNLVAKALLFWARDFVNAGMSLLLFMLAVSLIAKWVTNSGFNEELLLLLCLMLSQRLPEWTAQIKDLLFGKKDSEEFRPRRYVRHRCREYGCFPEYYDLREEARSSVHGVTAPFERSQKKGCRLF